MNHRILRSIASAALFVVGLAVAGPVARADLFIDSVVGGTPTGVSYANFDNLPLSPGTAGGTSGGITVSFAGGGQAVQGSVAGEYAAPFLSNNNGSLFGDPNNGADQTTYLSTETGTVTLNLPNPEMYLGLLWGSVDSYNTLTFFNGSVNVGSITGDQVTTMANGNQGASDTFYVNIDSTIAFTSVVATSSANSFEFDNVAYNPTQVITPEPSTMISATMAGLMGIGYSCLRRRRGVKEVS